MNFENQDELHALVEYFVDVVGDHDFWLTFGLNDEYGNTLRTTYITKKNPEDINSMWMLFSCRRQNGIKQDIRKEENSLLLCLEYLFSPRGHVMYHPPIINDNGDVIFNENPNDSCNGSCQEVSVGRTTMKVEMILTRPAGDVNEEITYTIDRRLQHNEMLLWMVVNAEHCYHLVNDRFKETKSARKTQH